jgi:hypothetical protein
MTYQQAVAAGRKAGAAHATDPELMAMFCESSIQILVGAVSPELVWEGAQARGLTTRDLAALALQGWRAVDDLQWERGHKCQDPAYGPCPRPECGQPWQ